MPKTEEEIPFMFAPQSQVTVYHILEGDEERKEETEKECFLFRIKQQIGVANMWALVSMYGW